MFRCIICDYTEEDGSFYANRSSSRLNKVHEYYGEYLCDECAESADENLSDLSIDDDLEDS